MHAVLSGRSDASSIDTGAVNVSAITVALYSAAAAPLA
jgi:hypothetical protein